MTNSFSLGGDVNVGTTGKQTYPSDETPPGYKYRPPETTYGDYVDISECPHNQNEYKARVEAGLVFFRAKSVGSGGNQISVSCSLISEAGLEEDYQLTVINGNITENYYATQIKTPDLENIGEFIYTQNAAEIFRADVNANSNLIDMPERAYDLIDNQGSDSRSGRTIGRGSYASTYPDGEDHIEEFGQTFLYGGTGVPENPTQFATYPATGPQRTVAHINFSERNTDNGTLILENILVQWAGDTDTIGEWVQCGLRPSRAYG